MRKLEGLRWEKRRVGQMGCARPSLAYQGLEVSFPWLYGATGHAFVINVAAEQDPSGPTCWNWQRLFRLTPNAGFRVEGFSVERQEAGDQFPACQPRPQPATEKALIPPRSSASRLSACRRHGKCVPTASSQTPFPR